MILHIPQLQYPLQNSKQAAPSLQCYFKTLEEYSEKAVHDKQGKVSYLYRVNRDDMIFEQVVIYYGNSQISFSYERTDIDTSEQLLLQLKKENIQYRPMSKTFLVST